MLLLEVKIASQFDAPLGRASGVLENGPHKEGSSGRTNRRTDRQTERQTDRQADRPTRQTDGQAERQTDRQTDRQTHNREQMSSESVFMLGCFPRARKILIIDDKMIGSNKNDRHMHLYALRLIRFWLS